MSSVYDYKSICESLCIWGSAELLNENVKAIRGTAPFNRKNKIPRNEQINQTDYYGNGKASGLSQKLQNINYNYIHDPEKMSDYVCGVFKDCVDFIGTLASINAPSVSNVASAGKRYLNNKDTESILRYLKINQRVNNNKFTLAGPNFNIWKDDVDDAIKILKR